MAKFQVSTVNALTIATNLYFQIDAESMADALGKAFAAIDGGEAHGHETSYFSVGGPLEAERCDRAGITVRTLGCWGQNPYACWAYMIGS